MSQKPLVIGFKKARVVIPRCGLPPMLILGDKLFFLPTWHFRFFELIRGLFPRCYAVGARSCDLGGQIYRWYPVFTWNERHANKLSQRDIGDGPDEWQPISVREFIRLYREVA